MKVTIYIEAPFNEIKELFGDYAEQVSEDGKIGRIVLKNISTSDFRLVAGGDFGTRMKIEGWING